jgi:hypothetical protein
MTSLEKFYSEMSFKNLDFTENQPKEETRSEFKEMKIETENEDDKKDNLNVAIRENLNPLNFLLENSDEEIDLNESLVGIVSKNNTLGAIYESADKFESFESLMKIDSYNSQSFYRVPFNIKGGKLHSFDVPWPIFKTNAKNVFNFKKSHFYRLDGFFFKWTPLLTHDKTKIIIGFTDSRGRTGKPFCINSVEFDSCHVYMSGMSVGTCIHKDDLKKIKMFVSIKNSISSGSSKYASLEACFYISATNRASLQTHTVLLPVVVPAEEKNLLKDYNETAEFLRKSNASIIERKIKNGEDSDNIYNLENRNVNSNNTQRIVKLTKEMKPFASTKFSQN